VISSINGPIYNISSNSQFADPENMFATVNKFNLIIEQQQSNKNNAMRRKKQKDDFVERSGSGCDSNKQAASS